MPVNMPAPDPWDRMIFIARVPRAILLCAFAMTLAAGNAAADWQTVKSTHCIVAYRADPAFAAEVSRHAERYYGQVTDELGFTRYSQFWLWNRRVSIFVYETAAQFASATGAPEWAVGSSDYAGRRIDAYGGPGFLDSVLPHEMTHLILREFMGFLIERFGAARFRTFCGHLRDGKSMDDALRFTYPRSLRSIEELEATWIAYLEEEP